jgi:large subunit ribosomal protein L3
MNKIALIGRKLGMSSMEFFNKETARFETIPLTLIKVEPNTLVRKMNYEKKSSALIRGGQMVSEKKISKPQLGELTKNNVKLEQIEGKSCAGNTAKEFSFSGEFSLPGGTVFSVGDYLIGSYVDITGRTKGKGFQGVMKRHGFGGMPASHGHSLSHRSLGGTGLGRSHGSGVNKGKKMAGHMGCVNVTVQNLKIVKICNKENIVAVAGSVPGAENSILFIKDTNRNFCSGIVDSINGVSVK